MPQNLRGFCHRLGAPTARPSAWSEAALLLSSFDHAQPFDRCNSFFVLVFLGVVSFIFLMLQQIGNNPSRRHSHQGFSCPCFATVGLMSSSLRHVQWWHILTLSFDYNVCQITCMTGETHPRDTRRRCRGRGDVLWEDPLWLTSGQPERALPRSLKKKNSGWDIHLKKKDLQWIVFWDF